MCGYIPTLLLGFSFCIISNLQLKHQTSNKRKDITFSSLLCFNACKSQKIHNVKNEPFLTDSKANMQNGLKLSVKIIYFIGRN